MSYPVYIALGSNLGDRLENLRNAVRSLFPSAPVCRLSEIYETPPWGYLQQPPFLNMAVEAQTSLALQNLLNLVQSIEKKMGREKEILNGPRVIDLDILFIESIISQDDQLTVPHPRMRYRGFVLRPMMDLAPQFIHPELGLSISALLQECNLDGISPILSAHEFEPGLIPLRLLPVEAARMLHDKPAEKIFNRLPLSHQQEYIRFISDAKKADTRQRRAEKILEMLGEKETHS